MGSTYLVFADLILNYIWKLSYTAEFTFFLSSPLEEDLPCISTNLNALTQG
jgi:hypothetical protein